MRRADREARLLREVGDSFPRFVEFAFGHLISKEPNRWGPPSPLQLEAAEFIQSGGPRTALFCCREFGKTTLLRLYPPWIHSQDRNARISVVSAGDDFSGRILSATRQLIRQWDYLNSLSPEWGQKDGAKGYNVAGAVSNPNLSMAAFTILGNIPGNRPDVVIADDIESLANSDTVKKRDILRGRAASLEHIPETKFGRILYAGTPQIQDSWYFKHLPTLGYKIRIYPQRYPTRELFEKVLFKDGDQVIRYGDCLSPKLRKDMEEKPYLMTGGGIHGKWGWACDPRFPEWLCRKIEKRCLTEQEYRLHYLLDTSLVGEEMRPLHVSNLMVMDLNENVGPTDLYYRRDEALALDLPNVGFDEDRFYAPAQTGEMTPWAGKVMAIDPSESKDGDETGYTVLAWNWGRFYALENNGIQGGFDSETQTKLAHEVLKWKVPLCLVEEGKGQGAWAELFRSRLNEICREAPSLYPELHKEPWKCALGMLRRGTAAPMKERRIAETLGPVQGDHRLILNRRIIEREYEDRLRIARRAPERFLLIYQFANLTVERHSLSKDDRLESLEMAVRHVQHLLSLDMARNAEIAASQRSEEYRQRYKDYCESVGAKGAFSKPKAPPLAIAWCYPFSEGVEPPSTDPSTN